ncbi:MAG: hypothetical protein GY820_46180 [Gammaproteobacteria bacterium]|nr:hypothetical protein [Gammaproteobacteria bacterium]
MHLVQKIKDNCTCTRTQIHNEISSLKFSAAVGTVLFELRLVKRKEI